MAVYVAPTVIDGVGYPAALWQAALDEIAKLSAAAAPTPTPITLMNGWSNRAGYASSSYSKIFNATMLLLVINITGGTTTNGTTIFQLPVGFRPLNTVQVLLAGRIAATPQQITALEIDSSGNARIYDAGASVTLHNTVPIPLNL